MKIRTDFVTNSSSSSYCTIYIIGSKLAEILWNYDEQFDFEFFERISERTGIDLYIDNEVVDIPNTNESSWNGPTDKNNMARCFIDFIGDLINDSGEPEKHKKLIEELEKNEEEINRTVSLLEWKCCHESWGSDIDDDVCLELGNIYSGMKITTWFYDGDRINKKTEYVKIQ